jgi:hypothetical protein
LEAVVAREIREVVMCDVCGSEKEVTTVAVAVDGTEQSGELCAEHREALMKAVADILPEPQAVPAQRPARQASAARGKAAKRSAGKRAERQSTPRPSCPHCGVEMSIQNLSRHIAAKHPATE